MGKLVSVSNDFSVVVDTNVDVADQPIPWLFSTCNIKSKVPTHKMKKK
jgi:hypothetical protein